MSTVTQPGSSYGTPINARHHNMTRSAAARKRETGAEPSRRSATPTPASHQAPAPHARRAGFVLIADDTLDTRELYAFYLRHVGYRVELASDGAVAVDMAIQLGPDVIVMDLSMPVLDGVAAIRRLKAHPSTHGIPVILLTGYPQQAIERGALEAGADQFLTKPCLPEDLEGHVRRTLEAKRRDI